MADLIAFGRKPVLLTIWQQLVEYEKQMKALLAYRVDCLAAVELTKLVPMRLRPPWTDLNLAFTVSSEWGDEWIEDVKIF